MKLRIIAVIMCFIVTLPNISFAATQEQDKFDLGDTDKQLHVLASYALAYTATDVFRRKNYSRWKSIMWGSLTSLAIGTIKEATDPFFSGPDMQADALGIFVSAGFYVAFDELLGFNTYHPTIVKETIHQPSKEQCIRWMENKGYCQQPPKK